MFDATAVDLGNAVATVPSGEVYAGSVSVKFSKLDKVEEGKSYLLPVRVRLLLYRFPKGEMWFILSSTSPCGL